MGTAGRKTGGLAGFGLVWCMAALLCGCERPPLEVPIAPWTRAWPAGELPAGMVGCLVLQQPRAVFEWIGPGLDRVGLRPALASLDPSGRSLLRWTGLVLLDPNRFKVPLVMAYDTGDPREVVDWQRRLRTPLATLGESSVWAPKGFTPDAVFTRGAQAIEARANPFLFLRLTDRRIAVAFEPVSLEVSVPYLLSWPARLGDGPGAHLRLRPDRLQLLLADLLQYPERFWTDAAAELERRLGERTPDWLGPTIAGLAGLVAESRWVELDLVLAGTGPRLMVRLAFEPGSAPGRWLAGLAEGPISIGRVQAGLETDARLLEYARTAGASAWREADHLSIQVPLGPARARGS